MSGYRNKQFQDANEAGSVHLCNCHCLQSLTVLSRSCYPKGLKVEIITLIYSL